ncbi:MAG: GNAT family N-acetyltransferase [Pyrinomonadaceae bacterium]|nr:GNAT family N-acetyltransferase [Pyrinomonadaceae bacterium]
MKAKVDSLPFETQRLRLRRFKDDDYARFLSYRNDPEIARYQSWESCSALEAARFIEQQKSLPLGVTGQWFQFAIELKETCELIGDCAFRVSEADTQQAEIGVTIARSFQKRGYGAEAVARLLDYGFVESSLHRIFAITDCENLSSVALLERLGMRREAHFIQNIWFKGKWGDEFLYAMLRDEWTMKRSAFVEQKS